MTFSGLKGPAGESATPLSAPLFGVASALCVVAAIIMAIGQWPDSTPSDPPASVEYMPALLLACLGLLGAILCAGLSCLIGAVSRLGS